MASGPASPSSRTHRSRWAFIAASCAGDTFAIRIRLEWKEKVARRAGQQGRHLGLDRDVGAGHDQADACLTQGC